MSCTNPVRASDRIDACDPRILAPSGNECDRAADPTVTLDRENDAEFSSFAVTLGRVIGPAFGGSSQVYMKPGVFVGGDRPADWGIEIGYKVIGF